MRYITNVSFWSFMDADPRPEVREMLNRYDQFLSEFMSTCHRLDGKQPEASGYRLKEIEFTRYAGDLFPDKKQAIKESIEKFIELFKTLTFLKNALPLSTQVGAGHNKNIVMKWDVKEGDSLTAIEIIEKERNLVIQAMETMVRPLFATGILDDNNPFTFNTTCLVDDVSDIDRVVVSLLTADESQHCDLMEDDHVTEAVNQYLADNASNNPLTEGFLTQFQDEDSDNESGRIDNSKRFCRFMASDASIKFISKFISALSEACRIEDSIDIKQTAEDLRKTLTNIGFSKDAYPSDDSTHFVKNMLPILRSNKSFSVVYDGIVDRLLSLSSDKNTFDLKLTELQDSLYYSAVGQAGYSYLNYSYSDAGRGDDAAHLRFECTESPEFIFPRYLECNKSTWFVGAVDVIARNYLTYLSLLLDENTLDSNVALVDGRFDYKAIGNPVISVSTAQGSAKLHTQELVPYIKKVYGFESELLNEKSASPKKDPSPGKGDF